MKATGLALLLVGIAVTLYFWLGFDPSTTDATERSMRLIYANYGVSAGALLMLVGGFIAILSRHASPRR